jgi:antitoxin (DNA-binding transcriptional repressor) of toxin-antitoxin stability system
MLHESFKRLSIRNQNMREDMAEFVLRGKISAEDAREHWADVVDYAATGNHVVISGDDKPLFALIPHQDFLTLGKRLEELYEARKLAQLIAKHKGKPGDDPAWDKFVTHVGELAAARTAAKEARAAAAEAEIEAERQRGKEISAAAWAERQAANALQGGTHE